MTTQKIIHYIPATTENSSVSGNAAPNAKKPHKHLRVAAYARVSTNNAEQQTSFAHQVEYYTKLIKSHKGWRFVQIYSDEGLSGLSTRHRTGFNQMLADAESGKIDLIITKSISRFARNLLDAITTVRHLKQLGVDVFFERENLHTKDAKSEFLLSILSSLAQEESRSISENITWGIRKNMASGKVAVPYKNFLGYQKSKTGLPEINRQEAKIVRQIYHQFLNGASLRQIARSLEQQNLKTPAGKTTWNASTIASILRNEKYQGDALLQKTFTADFLTHTLRPNRGERPKYYVEHSHPAIISREIYTRTQAELKLRAGACGRTAVHPFQNLVRCQLCGATCRRRVRYYYKHHYYFSWRCPAHRDIKIHEENLLAAAQKHFQNRPITRKLLTAELQQIIIDKTATPTFIHKTAPITSELCYNNIYN